MPYHVTVDVISLDRDPGKRLSNNGKWCLVHEMGKMLPPSPQAAPQWAPGPLLGSHTGLRGQTGTICLFSCMLLPQKYLTNHSSSKSKKKKLNRFWNIECHPSSFSLTWVFLHFLSLLSSSNFRLAPKFFSPSSSSSSLSRMSFHSELVFPILPTSPQARVWHPAQQGVSYKSEEGMKKKDCPPTQTSKSERSNN